MEENRGTKTHSGGLAWVKVSNQLYTYLTIGNERLWLSTEGTDFFLYVILVYEVFCTVTGRDKWGALSMHRIIFILLLPYFFITDDILYECFIFYFNAYVWRGAPDWYVWSRKYSNIFCCSRWQVRDENLVLLHIRFKCRRYVNMESGRTIYGLF